MQTIFIMVKCEPGRAYDVAKNAVDEIEEIAELHSISGQFDLMVKCYLPTDRDIGQFVVGRLQTLSGVKDTFTVLTFKAFK